MYEPPWPVMQAFMQMVRGSERPRFDVAAKVRSTALVRRFFTDLSKNRCIELLSDEETGLPHRVKQWFHRGEKPSPFPVDQQAEQPHDRTSFLLRDLPRRGIIQHDRMGMDLLREHDGFRLSQADTGSKSHDAGLILHLSADDPIGLSDLDTSRPASRLTHTLHVDGIGNDDLICQLMQQPE